MGDYTLTVVVELPDDLDEGTVNCLSGIVLGALADSDVPVVAHYVSSGTASALVMARVASLGVQMAQMIDEGAARREASPGVPDDLDALRARQREAHHGQHLRFEEAVKGAIELPADSDADRQTSP
jgi:hypothetical protein